MWPPASIPSITSASAPERSSFLASASVGANTMTLAPNALSASTLPLGGMPPASTTWPTPCLAQTSISSNSIGCMVIRLTPNGLPVSALVAGDLGVEQVGRHRPAGDHPEPAGVADRGDEVALGNPAHRPAQDRVLAAEELGAALHQVAGLGIAVMARPLRANPRGSPASLRD